MTTPSGPQPTSPSPADVVGRRLVRVIARNRQWTSKPLPVDAADELVDRLLDEIEAAGSGQAMVEFACGDGRDVVVRAREIVAVEDQACTSAAVIL